VTRALTASAEKRLLVRIAGAGYALARWDTRGLWLVIIALALNWLGDSLDGTLARVRRVERSRYGFYVDHVLDIVGITLLMAGLVVALAVAVVSDTLALARLEPRSSRS